ncbi:MAG: DUF1934 domain-containing protein [Eubacterium sp.]|nr:DUF1934 domain-containing protein [Eubacterium sp.]
MLNIILKVLGSQQIDTQKDSMEITTVATLDESDSCYILHYKEEQEQPAPPVDVCVKIQKDESRVEMTRGGEYASCLIIEKSRRNMCRYGTEYGDILMGISGHTIDTEFDGENGEFTFGYDIDINGTLASKNEVKMSFRKNQE